MLESIKKFFVNIYFEKGYKIGMYLLKNIGIAAICIILLFLSTSGFDFTFSGILEFVISLPILSIVVIIVRTAIKLIHKIFPMSSGLVKIIFDFIIFVIVIAALGIFISDIPMPESNFLQMLILAVFDFLYVGLIAFLLYSKKIKGKENEVEISE